jgi:bifunctional non-homologous end joining protein LigD
VTAMRANRRRATRRRVREVDVVTQLRAIEREGGGGTLTFPGGVSLNVSSLDKPYFPADRITKGEVMRFYARVAPAILPLIADRPLVLKRFPEGITGPSFFQQNVPDDAPRAVRAETIRSSKGEEHRRIVAGDLPTLLYTVQIGAIDVHPWLSRTRSSAFADYAVLDLDPGPKAPFRRVVRVAQWIRELMEKAGYRVALKTSGSRGLHLFIPMPGRTQFPAAQEFARTVASAIAGAHPKDATIERTIAKRPPAAVYVDFLQNAEGKSVAAPFSVRPREGGTVSTPLAWSEVNDALDPAKFTIASVPPQALRRAREWGRMLGI